jgi:hypothetical protein
MTGAAQPPTGDPAGKPVTRRRQTPCSHPPKTRPGTYPRRPGAGPGRPRRTHRHGTSRRPVRMILPDEPPTLTPAAARALLRVLLKAHAETTARQRKENPP